MINPVIPGKSAEYKRQRHITTAEGAGRALRWRGGGGHIDSFINLLFFLKVLMFYTELIYRPSYQEKTDVPLIQKSPFFLL